MQRLQNVTERDETAGRRTWASAHWGKWGQLTPWKMDEKLKSENVQKRAVFYVYVIFREQSGQGRQV